MTTTSIKHRLQVASAILLVIPALLVITASILKYGLGIGGLFDSIAPTMEKWGIKDPPGFNITSIVVFGPVIALLIAVFAIVKLKLMHSKEKDVFVIEVKNSFVITNFSDRRFTYKDSDVFKDKTLYNKKNFILTNYWDVSGLTSTEEEQQIIAKIENKE